MPFVVFHDGEASPDIMVWEGAIWRTRSGPGVLPLFSTSYSILFCHATITIHIHKRQVNQLIEYECRYRDSASFHGTQEKVAS
jgi:hypothetical protein